MDKYARIEAIDPMFRKEELSNFSTATEAKAADSLNVAMANLDSELTTLAELVSALEKKLSPLMVFLEPSLRDDEQKTSDNSSELVRGLRMQKSIVQEIRIHLLSIYERIEI